VKKNNRFTRVFVLYGLILLCATACSTGTTSVVAKNTTQPVMLGPIHNVKGSKDIQLYKKGEFDIKIEDSLSSYSTGHSRTTTVIQEGEEKIDVEVMKKAEGSTDKIVVDNVFVNSTVECWLIACSGRTDYAGIEGGVYTTKPVNGDKK